MKVDKFLEDMGSRIFLVIIESIAFVGVLFLISSLFHGRQLPLIAFIFLLLFLFNISFTLLFKRKRYFKISFICGVIVNLIILSIMGLGITNWVDAVIVLIAFSLVFLFTYKNVNDKDLVILFKSFLKFLLALLFLATIVVGLIAIYNLVSINLGFYSNLSSLNFLIIISSLFMLLFSFVVLLNILFTPTSFIFSEELNYSTIVGVWILFLGIIFVIVVFKAKPFWGCISDHLDPCYSRIGSKGPEYTVEEDRICVSDGSVTRTFKEMDYETFEDLNYGYAKDKNGVYRGTKKINADTKTFSTLEKYGYASDYEKIFYFGEEIEGLNPEKLKFIGDNHLYDENICVEKKGRNFVVVDNDFCGE